MAADAHERHALIIEDEMLIALELEHMLELVGFATCDIADSPDRALASALARPPDLITVDVRIIGGTGIEAVKAITRRLGPVPHVYVTCNRDMLKGQAGAVIVEKPIRASAFVAACQSVCP